MESTTPKVARGRLRYQALGSQSAGAIASGAQGTAVRYVSNPATAIGQAQPEKSGGLAMSLLGLTPLAALVGKALGDRRSDDE